MRTERNIVCLPMHLDIPEFALVVLIGPSGAGKSTFARAHFRPTEVLSSDAFRAWISDDENDQAVTTDAFEALHALADKRLKHRRLTVIDATNVQPFARKPLLALAKARHALAVAIVFDLPERVCHERNAARPERAFGPHVVRGQRADLRRSLGGLQREGFRKIHVLRSPEDVDAATVTRTPLWNDRRADPGPFDIVGDVHGCAAELHDLLGRLGYAPGEDGAFAHPEGRRALFLGDLMDRGPRNLDVYRTVRAMVGAGTALAVPGNHDAKLLKHLRGTKVTPTHGLDRTLAELAALPDDERAEVEADIARFIHGLVSHYVLDGGRLVVAHAGLKEEMQGRASGAVRAFCLYGETTGESDDSGMPVRIDWAREYRGAARVVYGHTPVAEAAWVNGTMCIDTGCVFGGRLSALRYPEMEVVDVPAREVYAEPARPLAPAQTAPTDDDALLRLSDVWGKRVVETRLHGRVTIREENAAAALETMSRFAADPRWLVYLPPTMSPVETSRREGTLEHPDEAFAYYRAQGVEEVVCEEKHMGSRAVLVVGANADATRRRFGTPEGQQGIVLTRTGRPFFDAPEMGAAVVARVAAAAEKAGLWHDLASDWMVLDAELMPWSAKAQALLRQQYAATAAAAQTAFNTALPTLTAASERGLDIDDLLTRTSERSLAATRYADAYRRYCWPVHSAEDLRLAPFHLLASASGTHLDRDHLWHMDTLARLASTGDALLVATPYRHVRLDDASEVAAATVWWEAMTAAGGEGMVVKPRAYALRGAKGLVQPAVKVRGREYLRLIYGPDYDRPEHLDRLRSRGLGPKRSLAAREFALGVEALERFARGDGLRSVHEAVFGILALESEPVDPRL